VREKVRGGGKERGRERTREEWESGMDRGESGERKRREREVGTERERRVEKQE
jgi:hypothetical protein